MPDVTATEFFAVDEIEQRLRLDDLFSEQLESPVYTWIMRQALAAIRAAQDGGDEAAVIRAVQATEQDATPRIGAALHRTTLVGADLSLRQLGLKAGETTFRQEMLTWAQDTAADMVRQVTQTTINMIRAAVVATLASSEGPRALADAIRSRIVGIGQLTARARAITIARTETHDAASYGADQAAIRSGVDYFRQWLSAEDARTRADHAAAHGQLRGPNEAFSIGGSAMMRPGQGPAAQCINCRCVLGYRPVGYTRKASIICV